MGRNNWQHSVWQSDQLVNATKCHLCQSAIKDVPFCQILVGNCPHDVCSCSAKTTSEMFVTWWANNSPVDRLTRTRMQLTCFHYLACSSLPSADRNPLYSPPPPSPLKPPRPHARIPTPTNYLFHWVKLAGTISPVQHTFPMPLIPSKQMCFYALMFFLLTEI
jgi:hypothetical protein